MNDIILVHSGFDTLYVAVQGALGNKALEILKQAKESAKLEKESQSVTFGPGAYSASVPEDGQRGGYAYRLEKGPGDITWAVMSNADPRNWNLFANIGSDCLLAHGLDGAIDKFWQDLEAMGALVLDYSVNRADYAMDFRIEGFKLDQARVLAHTRATVSGHIKENDDAIELGFTSRGRRLESITIGKMPGRQVIIYDKRREVIKKSKLHWFDVWNVGPKDRSFDIYRVELRAGKRHLKDQWQISSFEDLENSIGDVYQTMTEKIRYLDEAQTDSNASRQALHPLWTCVQETLTDVMANHRSGLTEGQIKEAYRDRKIGVYSKGTIGHATGLSVSLGLDDDMAAEELPQIIHDTLADYIRENRKEFLEKRAKLRNKLRFIESDGFDTAKYKAHLGIQENL